MSTREEAHVNYRVALTAMYNDESRALSRLRGDAAKPLLKTMIEIRNHAFSAKSNAAKLVRLEEDDPVAEQTWRERERNMGELHAHAAGIVNFFERGA